VFEGSLAYAVEVGNLLRDRAYRVVELLAVSQRVLTMSAASRRKRTRPSTISSSVV
jgi:hypothetical protein